MQFQVGSHGSQGNILSPLFQDRFGRAIESISLPKGSSIGAIVRGDEVLIPEGNFKFQKGDGCLVFTRTESLPELETMFRGKG